MKLRNYAIAAGIIGVLASISLVGQLQQSGGPGSQVTATLASGSALAGKFGIDQTTPGTTNGVQLNAALPAGTNVIGHVIADSGLISVVPKTACGSSLATGSTLAAVPISPTLLTSAATACVVAAVFFNTNATPVTVTFTDNTATPVNAVLAFSIPANSNLIEDLHGGAFNLGLKWSASGAGVTGFVVAYQ